MLELNSASIKIIEAIYGDLLIDILLVHGISLDNAVLIAREFFDTMRDY